MLSFWDRMWIVHMHMVEDYYKEREKQRWRWRKFCNGCIEDITNEATNIIKVIENAVSKQDSIYMDNNLFNGIVQLPLYGFHLVLRNQGTPSEDQDRLIDIYLSHLQTGYSKASFIQATNMNNYARQQLYELCDISDNNAGKFWVQFFKLLYRTDSDVTNVENVINSFCTMTMKFAAMNKKFDSSYLLRILESFINAVHKQSVLCRDLPKDTVDLYGDSPFIEHFNNFISEIQVVLDFTIEEQTEEMNTKEVIKTFVVGVIYQLVSRCHADREDKIKMVDDILSKLNYDLSVDGKYIFKYMEDLHGEETSMLAAMAHFYTDIDNNNPLGWIIVYRMSGSYNYQTHKPVHSLEEANNFMIGMDNYLNKKYPMRGYGRIAVEYLKRVGDYIQKDMDENVTFM